MRRVGGTGGRTRFLPRTGMIGGMIQFYFVFQFSTTYVPLVPLNERVDSDIVRGVLGRIDLRHTGDI